MTKAVIAEISATPRIIRPEALHAVVHRISRWRPAVIGGRAIVSRLAVGDGAADDGASGKAAEDASTHAAAAAIGVGCSRGGHCAQTNSQRKTAALTCFQLLQALHRAYLERVSANRKTAARRSLLLRTKI